MDFRGINFKNRQWYLDGNGERIIGSESSIPKNLVIEIFSLQKTRKQNKKQ